MVTFSTNVKNELCKISRPLGENSIKLLYGLLLFSRKFKISDISFYTENKNINELVEELIVKEFGCIVDITYSKAKKENIKLTVPDMNDREKILNRFGHIKEDINLKINGDFLKTKNDIKLFLRGVFLSCGSINDPQNGYHLEFAVSYMNLSKSLLNLFLEIMDVKFKVKTTTRKGSFVVYMKDSADITDFLTYIGAQCSAMELMQVKMVKEVRNYVNRTTNFETANMGKIATAAAIQIDSIRKIKKHGKFNCLDETLKELADLRIKNPEMSLRELGQNLSVPLTRSGVNHKMKKILSFGENL